MKNKVKQVDNFISNLNLDKIGSGIKPPHRISNTELQFQKPHDWEYRNKINRYFRAKRKNNIDAINENEKLTKRNIHLEEKIGIKKNLIKQFIEYYSENKQVFGKAENCFNEFKKKYPKISNDTYNSFKKTIYAYGFKLKKV